MAIAARRRTVFIRQSVQTYIGNTLTTATGNAYPVIYVAPGGVVDPDSASNDVTAPQRGYALLSWPSEGAGRRLASIMQADVFYRFGPVSGGAGTDPFKKEAAEIVDALVTIFSGITPSGSRRAYVPLLDFTNPLAPTQLGECVVCVNSRNDYGELESIQDIDDYVQAGMWHLRARWRFALPQDLAGPAAFYLD